MNAQCHSSVSIQRRRLAGRALLVGATFGLVLACSSAPAPDVIIVHDSTSGGDTGAGGLAATGAGPSFLPAGGTTGAGGATGAGSFVGAGSTGGVIGAGGALGGGGAGSTTGVGGVVGTGATTGAGGTVAGDLGLPCDVAIYFSAKCVSCHGNPPIPSALAALVTYDDLMKTAIEDPTMNEAELSLARMKDTARPMPPGAPPSAADIAIVEAWVNAGMPRGSCGGGSGGADGGGVVIPPPPPPPPSVFDGAPAYTARTGNRTHKAGQDCMDCHDGSDGEAPRFTFGGTVYNGSGAPVSGAEVRVVDNTGKVITVYSGSAGTFYSSTSFSAPAQVGIRNATAAVDMFTALGAQDGGCSSCHCTGTGCAVTPIHLP